MRQSDRALEYFLGGYNCSQSTAAPFASGFGVEPKVVLKMMAGFGGGRGGLRETCGAVSAMAFVASLASGDYPPGDIVAKTALYDLVKKMDAEFVSLYGTSCCRDLLLKASCPSKPEPSERNADYYARRPCACFVESAAQIIEKHILARKDAT
jgi:C_GCAxxG_C_C family probable redox protein